MQRNQSTLPLQSLSTTDDPPLSHHSRVLDHYSLPTPSSTVKFRSARVHVYDNSQGSQLIMEERKTATGNNAATEYDAALHEMGEQTHNTTTTTNNLTVKRVSNSSPELLFLRGLYSAIAFFMGAFLFIFAVGLFIFLISDIANQAREIIVYDMSGNEGEWIVHIIYQACE